MEQFQSIPAHLRAEPFVKWAGGKKRLLPAFDGLVPHHYEAYIEPFLGGGAVFLYLASIGRVRRAVLSDVNAELIHLYRTVRDDVEQLILALADYPYDTDFYYDLRSQDPNDLDDIERAARMLYLNRTCFNGLYRVNRHGVFNVPIGRYDSPVICNAPNLRNVSRLLQGVELQRWSFETTVEVARPGDLVYLDPPSHPLIRCVDEAESDTAPLDHLNQEGDGDDEPDEPAFDSSDDARLLDLFLTLDGRGCRVMLSQKASPPVRQRFAGFDVTEARLPGVKRDRSRTGELVIRNYS